jgi:hypothetical protein
MHWIDKKFEGEKMPVEIEWQGTLFGQNSVPT